MKFHEIIYSIAGTDHKRVYDLLDTISDEHLLTSEKTLLQAMLKSFESTGQFHSLDYLQKKFGQFDRGCKKFADFRAELLDFVSSRAMQDATMEVQEAVAESRTMQELQEKVAKAIDKAPASDIIVEDHSKDLEELYEASKKLRNTFITGVPAIDEITSGFGEGLVSSVVAWTSHGKSAFWVNAIHRNLLRGKKTVIISLEIPAQMVYYQLLSRFSYDLTRAVPYEGIIRRKISAADQKYIFRDVMQKFQEAPGAVRVLDGYNFRKWDEQEIRRVLRKCEQSMGGLDYVIVDHVNLFRYIDPNVSGDFYIKNFQQISLSYRTEVGGMIGVGFAVQANREGWKRAKLNEGQYDMTAISEFREIERASTYVTFLYADESMRAQNEAQVHLQKHRIGRVMEVPEVTSAYYPCSVFGLDHSGANTSTKSSIMDGLLGGVVDTGLLPSESKSGHPAFDPMIDDEDNQFD